MEKCDDVKRYKTRYFYNKNLSKNNLDNELCLKKCGDKRCKVCVQAIVNRGDITGDNVLKLCKVYNSVYRLRCKTCNMSYIGQSSDPFNIRFNNHKSDIRLLKNKTKEEQEIEIVHFAKHGIENIEISILNIVPNKSERLICEKNMMMKYGTVYPYGLNVLFDKTNVLRNFRKKLIDDPIYERFKHYKIFKKEFKDNISLTNALDNIKDIKRTISNVDISNVPDNIKHIIFNVKRKFIPELLRDFCGQVGNVNTDIGIDLIRYRIKKQNLQNYINLKLNQVDKKNRIYFVLDYMGEHFKDINFKTLLNKYNDYLPNKNLEITKAFRYDKPLGRVIFNYNKFAKELANYSDNLCNCHKEEYRQYIDTDYGHILTGNLNIVADSYLRDHMLKGTKFRVKKIVNKCTALKRLSNNMDIFIEKLSAIYGLPSLVFEEWRHLILKEFDRAYKRNNVGVSGEAFKNLIQSVRELQEKFIITYVDKANTNYAIICKKLYGNILKNTYNNNNNYELVNSTRRVISNRIKAFYKKIKAKQNSNEFPYLILIPKFHKKPITFRTVTCGFGTYIESANKKLLSVFNKITSETLDHDLSFIIKNSFVLLNKLKTLDSITGLITYDFEDLYNSIHLNDLREKIFEFYDGYALTDIDRDRFKDLFNFVVNENYLFDGLHFYRQIKGIPMGGSCSSILADFYLFLYERNANLISDLKIYRYIDDILVVYLNDYSNICVFDFYPNSLNLKIASEYGNNVHFLDIFLEIADGNLITRIYDKKKFFDFDTIKVLDFNSNVHLSIFRNIYLNELTRIDRLCSNTDDLASEVFAFYEVAKGQNYPTNLLNSLTKCFFKRKNYGLEVGRLFNSRGILLDAVS